MIASCSGAQDRELVEAVRDGDDAAFEELYRRYHPRIAAYVRRMVRDPARAEDLAQDSFLSALRRMRATEADIAFKPWIFEIARNAAIDHWRRSNRAEEVSVEADEQLRQSDRARLVGAAGPDSALVDKERLDHLRGAFDELSDVHTRILVMRELEGLSYREIAERLDLSRASVESALFRARRRLESEYADISEGRRCTAMRTVMARMAEGLRDKRDEGRLARHARRCHVCRRRARELGVEPLAPLSGIRRKAAALVPLPLLPRRGDAGHGGAAAGGQSAGSMSGLLPAVGQVGAAVAERTAAIVAAAALAGAGGMALSAGDEQGGDRAPLRAPATEQRAPSPDTQRDGAAAPAPPARDGSERSTGAGDRADGPGSQDSRGGHGAAGVQDGEHGGGTSAAEGAGAGAAGGEVGLPRLPGVPGEVGGGSPSGPSGDGPRLPEPPAAPAVEAPSAPDVPLAAPRVEQPPAVPTQAPTVSDLPQAGTDAVTAIPAG